MDAVLLPALEQLVDAVPQARRLPVVPEHARGAGVGEHVSVALREVCRREGPVVEGGPCASRTTPHCVGHAAGACLVGSAGYHAAQAPTQLGPTAAGAAATWAGPAVAHPSYRRSYIILQQL